MKNKNMNVVERALAPTPKWFKILRTVGIAFATVGGTIIASPVALPLGLVSAAGYLVLGGSIISVVSQTAVKSEEEPEPVK
jgi:ABC-type phosphate/phosphonate transport system permease subunit